ncbi:unnamed protein product [Onchocerca flexuosa]|uniref:DUF1716 domain-containing protein n=1 Tax=Onchocerca flexuosa TaxID=387005 RepID=A0A183H9U9_9BILA|nr:unnamed protein product [Onchocerca flexuosa]
MRKGENLERKKKKLKDKTKSSESKEMSVPIFNLPKLELPKPVITKGQAVIKLLCSDGSQDDEHPSVGISGTLDRDIVLQENANENTINGNNEVIGNNVPIKTMNIEKCKKNLEYDRSKRRKDTVRQNEPGADSFLKGAILEDSKNITKLSENQNLHPSWIAKKQEHEALKQLKASCKAKKIVFDDD